MMTFLLYSIISTLILAVDLGFGYVALKLLGYKIVKINKDEKIENDSNKDTTGQDTL